MDHWELVKKNAFCLFYSQILTSASQYWDLIKDFVNVKLVLFMNSLFDIGGLSTYLVLSNKYDIIRVLIGY